MNFSDPNDEKEQVTIELTSLIDVMFMMVLFFLVTTTFATDSGFNVNLPKSSAAQIQPDKEDLTIVIGENQAYALNQQQMTQEQLLDRLHEEGQANPNRLVIIRADQSTSHGEVVRVMDYAKQAGLHRLAIATEPVDP